MISTFWLYRSSHLTMANCGLDCIDRKIDAEWSEDEWVETANIRPPASGSILHSCFSSNFPHFTFSNLYSMTTTYGLCMFCVVTPGWILDKSGIASEWCISQTTMYTYKIERTTMRFGCCYCSKSKVVWKRYWDYPLSPKADPIALYHCMCQQLRSSRRMMLQSQIITAIVIVN